MIGRSRCGSSSNSRSSRSPGLAWWCSREHFILIWGNLQAMTRVGKRELVDDILTLVTLLLLTRGATVGPPLHHSTTTTANIHKDSWRRSDWQTFYPYHVMSCHHGLTIKYTHTALHCPQLLLSFPSSISVTTTGVRYWGLLRNCGCDILTRVKYVFHSFTHTKYSTVQYRGIAGR